MVSRSDALDLTISPSPHATFEQHNEELSATARTGECGLAPTTRFTHEKLEECQLSTRSQQADSGVCILRNGDLEKNLAGDSISSSDTSDVSVPGDQCTPLMSRSQEITFIFITCAAQFLSLSALNQTVAPVITLAHYYHVDNYGDLSWFSAAFSMAVGTFILPAGKFVSLLFCYRMFQVQHASKLAPFRGRAVSYHLKRAVIRR